VRFWNVEREFESRRALLKVLVRGPGYPIAIVDAGGQTSRPGVWAVGNASNAVAHLAHAAAAGTNVGPLVMVYLLEREVDARRRAR